MSSDDKHVQAILRTIKLPDIQETVEVRGVGFARLRARNNYIEQSLGIR